MNEQIAERVAEIARDVNELDAAIGEWGRRVGDGATAPPEVVALIARREALIEELRRLAEPAPAPRRPDLLMRFFSRLRFGRRG